MQGGQTVVPVAFAPWYHLHSWNTHNAPYLLVYHSCRGHHASLSLPVGCRYISLLRLLRLGRVYTACTAGQCTLHHYCLSSAHFWSLKNLHLGCLLQVHQPAAAAAPGSRVPPVQLGAADDVQPDLQPAGGHTGQELCGRSQQCMHK